MMATTPECPYCGKKTGLRQVHDGGGFTAPEYTCEGCFKATDTGPCFDDLPLAPIMMTPREAGIQAFYADESTSNTLQGLNAAFDAYEEAAGKVSEKLLDLYRDAVRIDAKMEGPQFMGCNLSALRRAWEADWSPLGTAPSRSEESYSKGFYEGLLEAADILRKGAQDHKTDAEASRKVLEGQAHELAAVLLSSWANGLEINADAVKPVGASPLDPTAS